MPDLESDLEPSAYEIRLRRDAEGIGLHEAVRQLRKERILRAIDDAHDFTTLRKLLKIVANMAI